MLEELLGSSSVTRALQERMAKLALHDASVLITGEPGVGKRFLARQIHARSQRSAGPWVALRAPVSVAELGAAFKAADKGSLLLASAEALEKPAQELLQQALREKASDTRVLSTSAADLRELAHKGAFKEELYWSLCGVSLQVPALRERIGDAEEIFPLFFKAACRELGKHAPGLPLAVLAKIRSHAFPGNLRELKDLAGVLAALCEGPELGLAALPAQMLAPLQLGRGTPSGSLALKPAVHEFERQYLLRVLKAVGGNQSKAARAMDIHRNTLILKMQELGIPNRRSIKSRG